MRRYNVSDITEQHYRALRLLIVLGQAEAHVVVKASHSWPPPISYSPRQRENRIAGEAIN